MGKKAFGLNEEGIQLAFYEDDELPSSPSWDKLGTVYKDTAVMQDEEGEEVVCECEDFDTPEDVQSLPGRSTLAFSTSDLDPATCYKAFGGTLSSDKKTWTAPKAYKSRLVAFKFTTRSGLQVAVAKALLKTRMNWSISKSGYGLLEHTLSVITDQSTTEGPMSISME